MYLRLDLRFDAAISFIVGDNGAWKSTLLEAIALKLNLPLIGGFIDTKRGFEAASTLQDFLDLKEERFPIKGFFF
jgi:predicted ATPase